MEKKNVNAVLSDTNNLESNELEQLKEYKSPNLTSYGDISELVLALGGFGTDGSGVPPFSLT